jgi:hypothetical protein
MTTNTPERHPQRPTMTLIARPGGVGASGRGKEASGASGRRRRAGAGGAWVAHDASRACGALGGCGARGARGEIVGRMLRARRAGRLRGELGGCGARGGRGEIVGRMLRAKRAGRLWGAQDVRGRGGVGAWGPRVAQGAQRLRELPPCGAKACCCGGDRGPGALHPRGLSPRGYQGPGRWARRPPNMVSPKLNAAARPLSRRRRGHCVASISIRGRGDRVVAAPPHTLTIQGCGYPNKSGS